MLGINNDKLPIVDDDFTQEMREAVRRDDNQSTVKRQKNLLAKMVEDKKAIIKSIRSGVATKTIEEERDVKFVTPV